MRTPRYILRRSLFPWKFQETIDETADYAAKYGIDEIVWMIDTEEFSHGLPTLDIVRQYLPWLVRSREQLAKAGTSMSINPWVTQGMRDAGWDLRSTFPDFDWLTDITGVQAKSQACPMGPTWRQWLCDVYEMYASTGPRVLWVEDDFRVHRHRPVLCACYCDRHVRTFSEKTGRAWTRETLAAEILRPGQPSPFRAQWLEHVGGAMSEVLEMLAARVHAKSPEVELGLMCSDPSTHATERRDWDRVARALAGSHGRLVFRPGMSNYSEWSLRGLYSARQTIASTLKCVRMPAHACSEVENYPYTRYSKSVRMTRAQVLLSAVLRCPSMTLNLYDHMGTPLEDEPQYGQMLRSIRPMVDALVECYSGDGVERGIGILHHEHGPNFVRLRAGASFHEMSLGHEPWADTLTSMGLTTTWGDRPVIAASGQRLAAYGDELDRIFRGGVLLDLTALECLREMGREDLAGVRLAGTFMRKERVTPMESVTDSAFGIVGRHMSVDQAGLTARVGVLEPGRGAMAVSQLVDVEFRPVLPGVVVCENELGGRVAVYPYDLGEAIPFWFVGWHRRAQLQAVASWLFCGRLPMGASGGAWPLGIRTDYPGRTMAAVMNLSLDIWPEVAVELDWDRPVGRVSRLGSDGRWSEIGADAVRQNGTRLIVRSAEPLDVGEAAVLRVE